MPKLFTISDVKPGIVEYAPVQPIWIPAIDKNGNINLKRVESYSIHFNTKCYRISHPEFGSFLATEDHSLLVYDETKDKVVKVSPKQLIKLRNKEHLYFIKGNKLDNLIFDKECNKQLIPVSDVKIEEAGNHDTYDFTVSDYQTFALANGLFVQDTMAVYMPLTIEAQREAKEKMFRKTRSIGTGGLILELSQGMILGLYKLTKEDKPKAYLQFRPKTFEYDYLKKLLLENPDLIYAPVVYDGKKVNRPIKTTLGRILVNEAIPKTIPFIDKTLTKSALKELYTLLNKYLNDDEILYTYDRLRLLGFEFATRLSASIPLSQMILPIDIKKLTEKLKNMDPDTGMKYINNELTPIVKKYVKEHYPDIYDLFESGARGSWSDFIQMALVKGYVEDAEGKIVKVPVTKGFVDNLNATEAFIISPAARAGIINRSVRTADAGYLTRRLVKAAANIKIDFQLKDCRTDKGLTLHVANKNIAQALIGRYLMDGTLITDDNYESFIGQTITIRSPIFCKSKKICLKCYGELHKLLTSENIGIQSAEIVGERGTQLIMKTFHTGGLAETKGIPQVLPKNHQYLKQNQMQLITNVPIAVTISKETADYKVYEDRVILEDGIAIINFKDGQYFEIDIQDSSYSIEFKNFLNIKAKADFVQLTYEGQQIFAEIELRSSGLQVAIQEVNKLFERRSCKDCDISKTLMEIFKYYETTGRKLVHFEVIMSNMVRSKSNLYIPYRLSNDKEYVIIGISQVPFYTSPLLALAFQNVGKAIESGLLFPKEADTTDFDKILLGEF